MIPATLIRTVPTATTDEVEQFWEGACALHPGWRHLTYRDPIDPAEFPLTSPHWGRCQSGAQMAGLIRLEALWRHGGVYLDSDMEMYRPLTSLLGAQVFAGYEDPGVVPDAVIGAEPCHPVIREALNLALLRLTRPQTRRPRYAWTENNGAWATGPGVTTTLFPGRPDVLLLPPGAFYPLHYSAKAEADWAKVRAENPWAFGAHRWHHSWR